MESPYFWLLVALLTAFSCVRVWRRQDQRKQTLSERARARDGAEPNPSASPTGENYVAGAFTSRWTRFKDERRRSGRYRYERF